MYIKMKTIIEFEVNGCSDCFMCNRFNDGYNYECLHPELKVDSDLSHFANSSGSPYWCPIFGEQID